jgi:hypothetical protein
VTRHSIKKKKEEDSHRSKRLNIRKKSENGLLFLSAELQNAYQFETNAYCEILYRPLNKKLCFLVPIFSEWESFKARSFPNPHSHMFPQP